MKYKKYKLAYQCVFFCLFGLICFSANAQKLPGVQKTSLRVPANIKIDGKAAEWGQYQAYNKNTEVYYSIANDDSNLYLIVKAEKPNMIKKSVMAGITLVVNRSVKKNDTNSVAITFPLLPHKENLVITTRVNQYQKRTIIKDTAFMTRWTDTLVRKINSEFRNSIKFMSVKGAAEFTDTLVSVYNEDNIRTMAQFDTQMNYVYELAIPLKYLGLSINHAKAFAYHLLLNGAGHRFVPETDGKTSSRSIQIIDGHAVLTMNLINQDWVYTTDFWGEYMLAK